MTNNKLERENAKKTECDKNNRTCLQVKWLFNPYQLIGHALPSLVRRLMSKMCVCVCEREREKVDFFFF